MKTSRLIAMARLEFRYTVRRPIFWMWLLVVAVMAFACSFESLMLRHSGDNSAGGKQPWVTSEFAIASTETMISLIFHLFFVSIIAGLSALREEEAKIGDILHATPLKSSEQIWGKFLGVMLAVSLLLSAEVLFMAVCNHLIPHDSGSVTRGPFHLTNYLIPTAILTVPFLLFFGGAGFFVGEYTRRPILIFFLPAIVLLFWIAFPQDNSAFGGSHFWSSLIPYAEPTGLRWMRSTWLEVDRGVDFYNHTPILYDAAFLWSRFVFAVVGLGCVAVSQEHFAHTLRRSVPTTRRSKTAKPNIDPRSSESERIQIARPITPLASLLMSVQPPGILRSALLVARAEVRELLAQPTLYLYVPLILIFTILPALDATGMQDTPLLLTSGILASQQMDTLTIFLCLLLLLTTVESLERDRSVGVSPIMHSLPTRTFSFLFGKFLAQNLVVLVILGAVLIASVIALLVQGRVPFEISPFALLWGLLLLPTCWLWIAVVMAIYGLAGRRAETTGWGLALLLVLSVGGTNLTWAGNLFLIEAIHWSDLSILEFDRVALVANRLVALGFLLFCAAIAVRKFPRRDQDVLIWATWLRGWIRSGRMSRGAWFMAPLILLPAVPLVWLALMIYHGFDGDVINTAEKDYWSKNLLTWRNAPLPALRAVNASMDLYPDQRLFRMQGTYLLANPRSTAIRAFPMTAGFVWQNIHWTMNGKDYVPENRAGLYIFRPDQPIGPGDSLKIGFQYDVPDPGISSKGEGVTEFVLPSSVVLTSFDASFVPMLGYDPDIGVSDDNSLSPQSFENDFYHGQTEPLFGAPTPFLLHFKISSPIDFTANSVGTKISDVVTHGRRTVVWESKQPIAAFNVVGGRWAKRAGPGVAVYYNPKHAYNVDEMLSALTAARRYYSEWFAPYPWAELKLNEFPALAGYAQGFPSNISFSEEMGFLTQTDEGTNAAFTVTAHESAHQWWGGLVVPGNGPGGNVLSEGLAEYSASMLVQQVKGNSARCHFMRQMESQYLKSRHVDAEVPLVKITGYETGVNQVTYEKGGWAFLMLRDLLGSQNMQLGLHEYIAKYRSNPDHPVLQDFLDVMRRYAPDKAAYDRFVQQWFYSVILPEYKVTHCRSVKEKTGWLVTAQVRNIGTGAMPVSVEVRGLGPGAEPTYVTLQQLTLTLPTGASYKFEMHCPTKPTRFVIDRDYHVLQLNRDKANISLEQGTEH